jgi:hypothetical protein
MYTSITCGAKFLTHRGDNLRHFTLISVFGETLGMYEAEMDVIHKFEFEDSIPGVIKFFKRLGCDGFMIGNFVPMKGFQGITFSWLHDKMIAENERMIKEGEEINKGLKEYQNTEIR